MRVLIGFIAGIATAYAALAIYQQLPVHLVAKPDPLDESAIRRLTGSNGR